MLEIDKVQLRLYKEELYSLNSVDNQFMYSKVYYTQKCNKQLATTKIGIRCMVTGLNVLLIGDGGVSGIHDSCYSIEGDDILICISDSIFSLKVSTLELNWVMKCDDATCFQIFPVADFFLIHGELCITAISKQGIILWEFRGRDIFVSPDGEDEINFSNDGIRVIDWEGNVYVLNIKGELIG